MNYSLLLVLSAALFAAAGPTPSASTVELPRFAEVDKGVYRGGQPTEEGFKRLQQMGVRTIVNLRVDNAEKEIVESLGMKYVHIPIPNPFFGRLWKRIRESDLDAALGALTDAANHPVFIHCQRGADRTGVMIAFYRIAVQKWSADRAYKEAREIGMRWWYRSFRGQILNRV
jgi:tyrosine-protein phosphatase SIW14